LIGWRWRHPTSFEPYGNSLGKDGVRPGSTVYVTATDPSGYKRGVVTIHGVTLRDLSDSTGASIAYYLCTWSPGHVWLGIETRREMHRACVSLVRATGATMKLDRQQLLVAVTPRRGGIIAFHGIDVHYSRGWQNGLQRTGFDTSIRVIHSGD
jgi:hypothetical protein